MNGKRIGRYSSLWAIILSAALAIGFASASGHSALAAGSSRLAAAHTSADASAATFTTINFPGAAETFAVSINDSQEIVGSYLTKAGVSHGFSDIGGKFTRIDDPAAGLRSTTPGSYLTVNDGGTIVGSYTKRTGGYIGFIDRAGHFTNIVFPHAADTAPYGINNAGTVVGLFYQPKHAWHGFIFKNGKFTEINHPGAGTGNDQGTGLDGISEDGTVSGFYVTGHNVWHGFLWKAGHFHAIGPANTNVGVNGISESGSRIVGTYWRLNSATHGFETTAGKFVILNDPAAGKGSTQAEGVNNLGRVVGFYARPGKGFSGFLYSP